MDKICKYCEHWCGFLEDKESSCELKEWYDECCGTYFYGTTKATDTCENFEKAEALIHGPTPITKNGIQFSVKIELGNQQTLAHQDKNGNLALNDPPCEFI